MAVLRYHKGIKSLTAQKKPLLKLISFKSIVFLETTQAVCMSQWYKTRKHLTLNQALFSWLTSSGHIHANNHLTFNDFTVGIQSLIVCGEMVFFSILFQFAYPIGPYLKSHQATSHGNIHHVGGFLGIKAFVAALNITDLLKGLIVAPAKLFRGRAMGKSESSSNIA